MMDCERGDDDDDDAELDNKFSQARCGAPSRRPRRSQQRLSARVTRAGRLTAC